MKVLLVDDEVDMTDVLAEILVAQGFEVKTHYDGAAAVETIENEAFDALITDVNLPGAKGPEVARAFHKKYPGGPVCVISGHIDAQDQGTELFAPVPVTVFPKPIFAADIIKWVKAQSSR